MREILRTLALAAIFLASPLAMADAPFCAAPAGPVWAPPPAVGDVVLAEYNMRLAPACSRFAPSDHKGDFFGLVAVTREMLSEGLACLRRQGLTEPVRRFEAILKPGSTGLPILLACGDNENNKEVDVNGTKYGVTTIANALVPASAGYPGVVLNLDWIKNAKVKNFKAALIHELFHTAAYDHEHNVDYAYFSAGCCFEDSEAACELLRLSVGKDDHWWTSEEYLKPAIKWFTGRDDVALTLLSSAAAAAGNDQRGVLAGILQYGQNRLAEHKLDEDTKKDLLARCLAAGGEDACRKAFPLKPAPKPKTPPERHVPVMVGH